MEKMGKYGGKMGKNGGKMENNGKKWEKVALKLTYFW